MHVSFKTDHKAIIVINRTVSIFLVFLFQGNFWFLAMAQSADKRTTSAEYIAQYKDVAIEEMKFYNIPASITLAQGLLESDAGNSRLAKESKNHFGIKCHKDWSGGTFVHDDETKNECFRKYNSVEESFRDHSLFLTSRPRYAPLFELEITDYKGWARTLKTCGYATNPQYAELLIKKIEDLDLTRFDRPQPEPIVQKEEVIEFNGIKREPKWPEPVNFPQFSVGPGGTVIYLNNGLKFIFAGNNDSDESIASKFRMYPFQIRKYNDLQSGDHIRPGQMIYLQKKSKKSQVYYHYVQPNETMNTISQMYGIRLKWLYKRNQMPKGSQPEVGQKLWLRETKN